MFWRSAANPRFLTRWHKNWLPAAAQTKAGLRRPTHATAELDDCSALSPWLPWSPVMQATRSQAQPSDQGTTKTCNGLRRSTGAGGTCLRSEIAVAAACARSTRMARAHARQSAHSGASPLASPHARLLVFLFRCFASLVNLVWFGFATHCNHSGPTSSARSNVNHGLPVRINRCGYRHVRIIGSFPPLKYTGLCRDQVVSSN